MKKNRCSRNENVNMCEITRSDWIQNEYIQGGFEITSLAGKMLYRV